MSSNGCRPTHGFTIWFTGLPCSGKSTISDQLMPLFHSKGYRAELLDGDVVRTNLSKGLSFSREDRDINIKRIGFVCNILTRNDVIAIGAAISPYRSVRDFNRKEIGRFVEVYAKCPLEECIKRDVKGMYKKALAGEIKGFTGVDDPYEEPPNPEVVCETDKETVDQSLRKIIGRLIELQYLPQDFWTAPGPVAVAGTPKAADGYTDEERAQVEKRLADLGYVE